MKRYKKLNVKLSNDKQWDFPPCAVLVDATNNLAVLCNGEEWLFNASHWQSAKGVPADE